MKKILMLCGVVVLAGAVGLWRYMKMPLVYGAFTGAPKVAVAEALDHPKDHLHKIIALEDTITKQCTSMGCYFYFYSGDRSLRVELAEIAMNAPKKRDGRKALVEGQLVPYDGTYQLLATAVEFK